jgi:hypothetical protein
MKKSSAEEKMRIILQLLETQVATVHQERFFYASMGGIKNIRDYV